MALQKLLLLVLVVAFVNAQFKNAKHSQSDIEELEKYLEDHKSNVRQKYRLHYHISAPVGWINDPNGFSYYKGEYHLFYQFYPYAPEWGPMHWGHVKSADLVNWDRLPTALIPEEEQCFSGSAVVDNDTLVLMYTAHIDNNSEVTQSQYLAFSDNGVFFEKYRNNPVLESPDGSPDFRDPKVWKHGDYWYVIIGSKTEDNRGKVLLFRSTDLLHWDFLMTLAESQGDLGYMWECPDFFELDGKFVLLMSPQGIEPQGDRYKNVHQTGYIIGSFNYETFEFEPEVEFQEIDFGHDFYAAQTMEANGRRYLVGWFNMWDVPHKEENDGWSGALTIIRELKRSGNRILMTPVEAMTDLREDNHITGAWEIGLPIEFDRTAEIIVEDINLNETVELLITGSRGGDEVRISWSPRTSKVAVDRGNDNRQVEWNPTGEKTWRIFLDASSLEFFCGEGEVVFSSRVFPEGRWRVTNLSSQTLQVTAYGLRRAIAS